MYLKNKYIITILSVLFLMPYMLTSCSSLDKPREVVVYTSVDQVFSEPVLKKFERDTGIKVKPVYDVEATKTVGLVNRLIAEKDRPLADVFWNGEILQTIVLKENGVLAAYKSPKALELPAAFVEKDGWWTGFGGRARVLIVNKNLVKPNDYPSSFQDFLNEKYQASMIGMANPVFGTASTHAAAIYAALGETEGKAFYNQLKARGIQILDGNSVVKDKVADGQLAMGITDTDDALEALNKGKPVEVIIPDQKDGQPGTLVLPNSVALVKGAPNAEEGKKLIDYLLDADTEKTLIDAGWIDVPSHASGITTPITGGKKVKNMNVNFSDIYKMLEISKKDMQEIFVK